MRYAVIGGGLVGGAIAYGLARRGHTVEMFDEGDIAFRASRGNFGLIWVQGKGLGLTAYSSWTQRSAGLWPAFAAQLREDTGIDLALEQSGGFHLCLSENEMRRRIASLQALMAQPGFERYDYQVLDRRALAATFPQLGPTVVGGTYSRLDGHVNPLRLLRALHQAFIERQGVYIPNSKIDKIRPEGSRFVIETANRKTTADRVILAAGLGNTTLAPTLGLRAPVRPQRGQIVVLERMARFMSHPTVTLRQTDEGTVLIGDSQEEAGFDERVGSAILATLADRAVRTFPALRDARVVRTWAALRVMSADGFPIYDQSRVAPGAFIASCHSGVTLAAAHALDLAPQIATGELGPDVHPFSAERFNV
jgi:hydrogen cyanide synthase HcnC